MTISRRTLLKNSSALAGVYGLPLVACSDKASRGDTEKGGTQAAVDIQRSRDVDDVLQVATDLILNAYPESASSMGVDTGKYAQLKSKLTDRSAAGQNEIKRNVNILLERLEATNDGNLPADQARDLNVVRTVFKSASEGFEFPFGDMALLDSNWSYRNAPYTVAQNTGAFVEIPSFLEAAHSIESPQDGEDYLKRMLGFAGQLLGETERVRLDAEQGIILPDFLMKKTLGQFKATMARPTADWGIVKYVSERTAGFDGDFAARAQTIADETILPAVKRQHDTLNSLASKATSDAGIGQRPNGRAYYDWALRVATTTNLTPSEVHELGKSELAVLHNRMDKILRSIDYTSGTVGERMTALAADKTYQFSDGDKGRAEIMEFIENTLSDIRGRMPQAFHTLVPGYLEVTRIAPEAEAGAPGAYGGPGSIDGKKPGHFWINLRTPHLHNKFSLADLTYHEAIPGHVWQGEYTFKQPLVRSLLAFNAYSEGWALYAEQIADELGVYDGYPVGRLGYLQSLAFRACRLVVDTGLHAKGWSREKAIDFFVTKNGSNPEEVRSEVDRYCAWPGQACGYKVGHSQINRLRTKAMAQLGENYDFRAFNDAIVLGGSVPMTVLSKTINDYIANAKG